MPRIKSVEVMPGASPEGIYDSMAERPERVQSNCTSGLRCLDQGNVKGAREMFLRILAQADHDVAEKVKPIVRPKASIITDQVSFETSVRTMLEIIPEGIREGTDDTPRRVARMYLDELCSGYYANVEELLRTFPNEDYDGMILVRDIPLVSLCEHHLVPFVGHAHVGYFPRREVVGLSKVARVVQAFARRLQIQERLTRQVCHSFDEHLDPRGVMVVVEAEHLCMTIRGAQAPGTKTVTSAVTGLFNTNQENEKEEFLRLIGKGNA